jgi:DNA (cytosine-5)-methyltransferase 1
MTTLPARIRLGEVEAPDVFCGGTPCQAFSVAGLRRSLDDARGNLSLTFCEIANAIDDVRRTRGEPECIVFWENVPGVLSTQDNAFGCFISALAGCDTPIDPLAATGWTDAGVVAGPERTVAWRVLDAQYFGLAQRRKRVFVVASARNGFDPAAVLFEWDGVRRDSAPSREAAQGAAPCVTAGAANGGAAHGARSGSAKDNLIVPVSSMCLNAGGQRRLDAESETLIPTIGGGFDGPVAFHPTQDPISSSDGSTHAIGCGSKGGAATVAVALQDIRAMNKAQNGRGWNDDGTAYTVDTHATQGVAVAFDTYNQTVTGDTAQTLCSRGDTPGGSAHLVPAIQTAMQVRRLTPEECERLQGFPDGYTNIPWRGKSESPDGPRYKALGNSWAVPVVRWIGRRIAEHLA